MEGQDALHREEVLSDLETWLDWTAQTHPDLSYSVDLDELGAVAQAIRNDLPARMGRAQAWKRLARLNPVLGDAHLGIAIPDPADRSAPQGAFGALRIDEGLQVIEGSQQLPAGAIIIEIGGKNVAATLDELTALTRGESDALRERIVDLKLASYLALAFGVSDQLELLVRLPGGGTERRIVSARLQGDTREKRAFRLDWAGDTAILRVPSFRRERETQFARFLAESFSQMARRETDTLMIDLRENGGGARELSDRLMAYLTAQPYSPISAVSARITPENQQMVPGSRLGDAITIPFRQEVRPPQTMSDRFEGDVIIAIGSKTYSQAIVFAATALDHNVAMLCGTPSAAPANQTGQVQVLDLPHTGFQVRAPIYVFYRMSGDRSRAPLKPERACPID